VDAVEADAAVDAAEDEGRGKPFSSPATGTFAVETVEAELDVRKGAEDAEGVLVLVEDFLVEDFLVVDFLVVAGLLEVVAFLVVAGFLVTLLVVVFRFFVVVFVFTGFFVDFLVVVFLLVVVFFLVVGFAEILQSSS
jgi:hypothetical protein